MSRLSPRDRKAFSDLVPIIDVASGSNPRSAVRFVNNLLVDRAIFRATAGDEALREMPVSFFAVSRSIQQRWPAMFAALARSDNLCNEVAKWLKHKIPDVDSVEEPALKETAGLLQVNPELVDLLQTDYGLSWLSEHAHRSATIDFLQTERAESKEQISETPAEYDVFLSYSWDNREAAEQVRSFLVSEGIKVFDMTQVSAVGATPQSVLESAISNSRYFVFLIGAATAARQNVMLEIGMAMGQKKRVIPVLLPGVEGDSVPFSLRNIQWLKLEKITSQELYPILRLISEGLKLASS